MSTQLTNRVEINRANSQHSYEGDRFDRIRNTGFVPAGIAFGITDARRALAGNLDRAAHRRTLPDFANYLRVE
jgi:hypothetical protein